MNKTVLAFIGIIALFSLGVKCASNSHEEAHHLHLLDKIRQHQNTPVYDYSTADLPDSTHLLEVHAGIEGVANFFTERRHLNLTSFPCSNCHNQPLEKMQSDRKPAARKAHWDIHLAHAENTTMTCTTCHAANNMNQLTTIAGAVLDIDESFKLCGQCHSTQYKDWQGGAHGKELNGWKPPRIAKTCVSCHNPHQPAFPKRFPARLNTVELGE